MPTFASRALFLASLALAACGGDGGKGSSNPDTGAGDTIAETALQDAADTDMTAHDATPDTAHETADVGELDQAPTPDIADDANPEAQPDAGPDPWTVTCGGLPILGPQGDLVSAACKACVDDTCCDEAEACAADADCLAMRRCMAECSDAACTDGCWTMYAGAQALATAFTGCRATSCYDACADATCIGKVVAKEPAAAQYEMTLLISSMPDGQAVQGASIRLCPNGDSACTTPGASATTNAYGIASVDAPSSPDGLAGYLEVSGPTILTVLYHRFRYTDIAGLPGSLFAPVSIAAFPPSTVDLIASIAGIDVDPTRGIVFFSTRGCAEGSLGNVVVTTTAADDQTKTVYIVDGMPSTTATMTTPNDASGVIFNVPLTTPTITITSTFAGFVYSTHQVHVRVGALTSLDAVPTP